MQRSKNYIVYRMQKYTLNTSRNCVATVCNLDFSLISDDDENKRKVENVGIAMHCNLKTAQRRASRSGL